MSDLSATEARLVGRLESVREEVIREARSCDPKDWRLAERLSLLASSLYFDVAALMIRKKRDDYEQAHP